MTAHEIYEILVGSIGHHTLLYELKNWQVRAAVRGYYRKQRHVYDALRLASYWIVCSQRSSKQPPLEISDLITFPWEKETLEPAMTLEEAEELRQKMIEERRKKGQS